MALLISAIKTENMYQIMPFLENVMACLITNRIITFSENVKEQNVINLKFYYSIYIISRLILIQVGMDHKNDKALSHNIIIFSELKFETFD